MKEIDSEIKNFFAQTSFKEEDVVARALFHIGLATALSALINAMRNNSASDPKAGLAEFIIELAKCLRDRTGFFSINVDLDNPFASIKPLVSTLEKGEQSTAIGILYAGMSGMTLIIGKHEESAHHPLTFGFCRSLAARLVAEARGNRLTFQGLTKLAEMPLDEALAAS